MEVFARSIFWIFNWLLHHITIHLNFITSIYTISTSSISNLNNVFFKSLWMRKRLHTYFNQFYTHLSNNFYPIIKIKYLNKRNKNFTTSKFPEEATNICYFNQLDKAIIAKGLLQLIIGCSNTLCMSQHCMRLIL